MAHSATSIDPRHARQPVLAVKRKVWRKDDDHAYVSDSSFEKERGQVFQRDLYACQFCGFKASKYQEVHHVDDDHTNNDRANLTTVCTLCHQVHHLGMCGMRGGGFMAVLPELTQTEVNHLVRAMLVAEMIANKDIADRLRSVYAQFQVRGVDTLKRLFGVDISPPLVFAQLLADPKLFPDDLYATRSTFLAGLRLVPTKEAFHSGQLEYYAANNSAWFKPEHWSALARQLTE